MIFNLSPLINVNIIKIFLDLCLEEVHQDLNEPDMDKIPAVFYPAKA